MNADSKRENSSGWFDCDDRIDCVGCDHFASIVSHCAWAHDARRSKAAKLARGERVAAKRGDVVRSLGSIAGKQARNQNENDGANCGGGQAE
jgi:hypothetical protein